MGCATVSRQKIRSSRRLALRKEGAPHSASCVSALTALYRMFGGASTEVADAASVVALGAACRPCESLNALSVNCAPHMSHFYCNNAWCCRSLLSVPCKSRFCCNNEPYCRSRPNAPNMSRSCYSSASSIGRMTMPPFRRRI
jgi:hypothetical protein